MPETPSTVPAGHPFRRKGRGTDGLIKFFFASNAGLTIIILVLIIVFLVREGAGFFPKYRDELELYRRAGLEFVDLSRKDLSAHEQMSSLLNRAYYAQVNAACREEMLRSQEALAVSSYLGEAVAPAQSALQRVAENAGDEGVPQDLQAALTAKYKALLADGMAGKFGKGLPPTPHLSAEERQLLFDQIEAKDPLSYDDPAFLTQLQDTVSTKQTAAAEHFAAFRETIDAFAGASSDLDTLVMETGDEVKKIKEAATLHEIETTKRDTLLEAAAKAKTAEAKAGLTTEANAAVTTQPVDFASALAPVLARKPELEKANVDLTAALEKLRGELPANLADDKADRYLGTFRKVSHEYSLELSDTVPAMNAWSSDTPVSLGATI